ncbi:MAG: LysM peptidoglycan-binding domain-containing protein [Deltaproteobacteria bacterium]|jgi:hypothetical protein|nr:LysM peptidoglycan-binding domain-containing protein [Deltaproteobacteria bacterium]
MKRALTIISAFLALALLAALSAPAGAQDGQETQVYVVQQGDTANRIAKRFYGKSSLGSRLMTANRNFLANPKKLTPGERIYIFPESTLALRRPVEMPPLPEVSPSTLYKTNKLLQVAFPKNITFAADIRGLGGSGVSRIRIHRRDPITGNVINDYFEVRPVGEVISSQDRGANVVNDGFSQTFPGRTLLSTGDIVIVRFNEDVAKILDSDTYDDPDPYFRSFPVYTIGATINEPDKKSPNYGQPLGNLVRFRGTVTIGARIEGLIPPSQSVSSRTKRNSRYHNSDLDPVSYEGVITYTEDPIEISDKVMLFVPLDPGPERRLDSPYVEPPDTYVSPGR